MFCSVKFDFFLVSASPKALKVREWFQIAKIYILRFFFIYGHTLLWFIIAAVVCDEQSSVVSVLIIFFVLLANSFRWRFRALNFVFLTIVIAFMSLVSFLIRFYTMLPAASAKTAMFGWKFLRHMDNTTCASQDDYSVNNEAWLGLAQSSGPLVALVAVISGLSLCEWIWSMSGEILTSKIRQ